MNKRQSTIVNLVNNTTKISVTTLAKKLNVSEVTIRKDLTLLSNYGIIIREHGFAIKKNSVDIRNRLSISYDLKQKIAKKAAQLINFNETIIIGSGSTCALLAEEIARTKPNVTILTHSIYIVEHASKLGNNKIILFGGEYQNDSQVMVGPLVRLNAKQYFVDKIFLGTDGFVKEIGFMGSDSLRTEAIQNMAESARHIVMLTDSSKFNKMGILVQFSPSSVSRIITDNNISSDYLSYFKGKNIKVDIVN
ncbi:MAG TPA: DeoR family transcriptional regulator [Firmicutes bacterium]|nr:DeoR family transcriptional regulator [Bacillota bacterium]